MSKKNVGKEIVEGLIAVAVIVALVEVFSNLAGLTIVALAAIFGL